jgi:hypothetical protein
VPPATARPLRAWASRAQSRGQACTKPTPASTITGGKEMWKVIYSPAEIAARRTCHLPVAVNISVSCTSVGRGAQALG